VHDDRWRLVPGARASSVILSGVSRARRAIAVASPAAFQDPTTSALWGTFWRRDPDGTGRQIIPVRVAPYDAGPVLDGIEAIDLADLDEEAARERLLTGVGHALAGRSGPAPRERPAYPPRLPPVHRLPPAGAHLVERPEAMAAMRRRLRPEETHAHVLRGPGGTGKTQLAIAFALRHAADYDLIWWVSARRPEVAADEFAALGERLGLPPLALDAQVEAVRAELARRDRWLVVLDDAAGPADIARFVPWLAGPDGRDGPDGHGEPSRTGGPGEPGGPGGPVGIDRAAGARHVLVTSRGEGWGAVATVSTVGPMDRAGSRTVLRRRVPGLDETSADALAAELADLPLALAQGADRLAGGGLVGDRLVQAVLRSSLTPSERAAHVRAAVRLLRGEATRPASDPAGRATGWPIWRSLLPHVLSVLGQPDVADAEPDVLADLLEATATYLLARGDPAASYPLAQRALAITLLEPVADAAGPDGAARQEALLTRRRRQLAGIQLALGLVTEAERLLLAVVAAVGDAPLTFTPSGPAGVALGRPPYGGGGRRCLPDREHAGLGRLRRLRRRGHRLPDRRAGRRVDPGHRHGQRPAGQSAHSGRGRAPGSVPVAVRR
jgi:hypothetical protein